MSGALSRGGTLAQGLLIEPMSYPFVGTPHDPTNLCIFFWGEGGITHTHLSWGP